MTFGGNAPTHVLVLGVGNPLRGDDGVGHAVIERLREVLKPDVAELRDVYQLTPELAADIAADRLVVVVDASIDVPPGEVAVRDLAARAVAGEPFSHSVDPSDLVALAQALYGGAPRVVLVGVGPVSMEAGEGLSPAVAAAVGVAADAIAAVIGER